MAQTYPKGSNALSTLVWGVVAIGIGVYRLAGPHTPLTDLGKIFGIGCIVSGALLVLSSLLLSRLKKKISAAAQRMSQLNTALYGGTHEREMVGPGAISTAGLDRAFYEQATAALEALGFVRQGDYVNLTLRRAMPNTHAVIRALIGDEGRVICAVYHALHKAGTRRVDSRVVEFETELSSGEFITTSNSALAGKTSEFIGISRRHLPVATSPAELLAAHRQHVDEVLTAKPGVSAVAIHDLSELLASQDRLQMVKVRFRNSAAFDPAAEIRKVAGKPLNEAQAEYAAEAARLHAERVANHVPPPPTA